jgi:hypothetical protein
VTVAERLDRLYAPIWAGGWDLVRWGFALSQLGAHLWRIHRMADAYAADDMVFTAGPWQLARYVTWSLPTAWAWWSVALVGLVGLLWGGRLAKPGLVAYLAGAWALMAVEALDVKAHDRLALWMALGLLLAPIGERGLTQKWRSPWARWYLLVVFSAIYGSTGLCKVLEEPGWFDGTVLQYHLVHRWHAGSPLALWVSAHWPITLVMGWVTIGFECAFPLLVWVRRTNPWILLAGVAFHLGLLVLMQVGPFPAVSLAAYPVLLDPELARVLWLDVRGVFARAGPDREPGAGDLSRD